MREGQVCQRQSGCEGSSYGDAQGEIRTQYTKAKLVHILNTCASIIDWKTLQRDAFDNRAKKSVTMKFLRLNLIDTFTTTT